MNNKHIPKYIIQQSNITHHLLKHGFNDVTPTLKDTRYFDIEKRIIVLEEH